MTIDELADYQEDKAAKIFIKALRYQYEQVAKTYKDTGVVFVDPKPIELAIARSNTFSAISSLKWQYNSFEKENKSIVVGSLQRLIKRIQAWVLINSASQVTRINATTEREIRFQVSKGIDEGLGAREIAALIRNSVTDQFTTYRATVIARTETTRAASYGHKSASDEWEAVTGTTTFKEWMATSDKRTRNTHRKFIKKVIIQKNELFEVGQSLMEYPGDPAGGAKEVVNCRCRVVYFSERTARERMKG